MQTDMQHYVSVRIEIEDGESMSRQVTVAASEGHRKFGQLLKRVYNSDEHLVVERDGFPVAVLLSYQEYLVLTRQRAVEDLQALTESVGSDAEEQGLTEEQLLAELKEVRRSTYDALYGKTTSP